MRVYIDELPTECCDCPCDDDCWRCGVTREPIPWEGRRGDCPLREIVHCGDCMFWNEDEAGTCGIHNKPGIYTTADDYCSFGVWKDEDDG